MLGAVLLPVFAPHGHYSSASNCMSNMKQIGNAVKMYLSDWDYHFPTNRPLEGNDKLGEIQSSVKLTPPAVNKNNKPVRFKYGVNWVEGLYNYVEPVTEQYDEKSIWKCPVSTLKPYPPDSKTANVSYVFNRNLIEKKSKWASNLMMIRESDRLMESDLRPTNNTTWTSKKVPICPFLTKHDDLIGSTSFEIHLDGSMILFADGHVKRFNSTEFPGEITKEKCWDPETSQWYNHVPVDTTSIAITP